MGNNLPCKLRLDGFHHGRLATSRLTTDLGVDAVDAETPLIQAELQVLRDQYEKEGEMVGVQTKFNYAWVCQHNTHLVSFTSSFYV